MRGILLAGGAGSRLDPITRVASKQLQPVYDKPMVYYPLATLVGAGISEVLLISTPDDLPRFADLIGDGRQWGLSVSYAEQPAPEGIAQALLIAEAFVASQHVELILGDNIFHGEIGLDHHVATFDGGATIFSNPVANPRRYGVVEYDDGGSVVSIEEKPERPRSRHAVTGLYLYDSTAVAKVESLEPSARGELEISDLNRLYLREGTLRAVRLGRGIAWLDSGTADSLLEAANYIATVERRQGVKVACIEEIAFRRGLLSLEQLRDLVVAMPDSHYRQYLDEVVSEEVGEG